MARASKVCSAHGCPNIATFRGMCTSCAHDYEVARGSTTQRGYDARYRKEARAVKEKATHCSECGVKFTLDNPATAGHTTAQRHGGTTDDGLVAQCRRCNYGWRKTGL